MPVTIKKKPYTYEDFTEGVRSTMRKRGFEEGVAKKNMRNDAIKGSPNYQLMWRKQQIARDNTLNSADSLDAINPDISRDGFRTLRGLLEDKYSQDLSEAHLTIKKKDSSKKK